jgi:hypothetical protein
MEDIRIIATRLNRMLKARDQALLHGIFWDDLHTLLNKILAEEKDE